MSGIKYYQLGNDEELPDEFCVVRDLNGEPAEYTWYEPIDSFDRELWNIFNESDWVAASEYRKLKAENAKLREDNDRLIQAIENLHDVSLEDRLVQLENSNDKLRELVAYMWTYDYAGHFSTLPEHMEHVDVVWRQMQLLGIEVAE